MSRNPKKRLGDPPSPREFYTLVEDSFEDVIAAARLKAAYPLSFADCLAAATSIRAKAPLVIGDAEIKTLEKLKSDLIGGPATG